MIEVRIHGRGGQGNVVAAYLLATAAFEEGRHCQAFPSFGAERRGAPVTAFVRIDDNPIQRRCQVRAPDFLIIQDSGLLHVAGVTEGLKPGGGVLVNSPRASDDVAAETGRPTIALPASQLAADILGRPMPNVALLAAFLTITGIVPVDALGKALGHRFKGDVLERNRKLIDAAAALVPAGLWREAAHA
ncbi:MAG: 2-oxoacid:acceptor oxidoreductase family protein [Alphaproteobacteria bacterium]|nr:2-oxoacid:acceptor oxidoreductase family protein [Alphaproteobacteria bacterium]